ncbi:hypothetical protein [Mycolicibacterium smegmatis]|uniref:hypothetical protein n=1 Tax=Mycolicibacterium smegmatis TaxID=1772 RepID=UPI001EFB68FD|nr:hypothetical protein [Mycolicibacterium smegmatis]ULN33555.1 hypothetical protein KZ781_22405 [Mycolicibacterium smegmatis]
MGFDHKTDYGYSHRNTGDSEFSWGPGPVPPGAERKPPSEGGQYVGRSPDMVNPPKGKYRRSGAPFGYAGEQVAR